MSAPKRANNGPRRLNAKQVRDLLPVFRAGLALHLLRWDTERAIEEIVGHDVEFGEDFWGDIGATLDPVSLTAEHVRTALRG